jgi:predicted MFS family arabinose efflux permease
MYLFPRFLSVSPYISERASWRSPFYLIAGISCLCALGGFLVIDADVPSTEKDKRVDWMGAFLVTTGLVLLVFVLGQGSLATNGWKTGCKFFSSSPSDFELICTLDIIALLIVSVLFLVMFILWQHYLEKNEGKHRPPLMKLSLWSRAKGKFAVMQAIAFFQWAAFLSWYFWAQVNFVRLTI